MFLVAQAEVTNLAGPDLMPSLARMAGALGIVLALLAALAWLLRRGLLKRRKAGALSIETALPLGERRSLAIVTVEGRRLLIGLAPGHVSLVTELAGTPPSFDRALERATTAAPEVRA